MPVILLVLGLLVTALFIPGAPRRVARCVVLSVLCLVFLPVSIIVGAAGWTARLTLLEPSFHLAILKEVNMYGAIPEVVSGMAVMHLDNIAGLKPAQRETVANALRAAVSESISPAWVEGEVSRIVEGSLEFLKGGGRPPDLGVSMAEPKARIMEQVSAQKLPAAVLSEIRKMISVIPDRLPPTQAPGEQSAAMLLQVRPAVQVAMSAGPGVILAGAVMVFIVWLLAGRGGGFPAWVGSGCMIGGLAVLALTMAGRISALQATGRLTMPAPFSGLPVQAWAETAVLRVLGMAQFGGGLVAAAGAILVVVPLVLRPGRGRASPGGGGGSEPGRPGPAQPS